jgi:hypothetical protein
VLAGEECATAQKCDCKGEKRMWKKDDAMNTNYAFGSNQMSESPSTVDQGTVAIPPDSASEKGGRSSLGPQRILGDIRHQPSMPASIAAYPANMAAYSEAVNEFTKTATAFMEHLPLLSKARNAYDQAMKASAEIRKVLDTGDEDLRTLMSQLMQAVSKPVPDKKKPELAKMEARGSGEDTGTVKAFS